MTTEAPYPGLHPFDCDEADVFFGREEQTDQLLEKLGKYRFLAVVGPSGCGKSSLVRAGLISNLSGGFMASAGARWRVAVMRPGRHPMRRLTEALLGEKALGPERGDSANAHGFLGATLWRGPLGLVEALRETPLRPDTNLLLLVDQFEEIFRFRNEEERDEADAFVALMVESAEQLEQSIYVVMTMRSDYIGDCGQFQGLPEHVSESQFLTPRLSREQRKDAITGPARVFGGDVDGALVNRLLNETSSDPDHLPVLQHLLMRMWSNALQDFEGKGAAAGGCRADGGPCLTVKHYVAVGGLKSALSNHANEAYDRLNPTQQGLAEIMFRRLCEFGSDHMYTRRPTSIGEIADVAGVTSKRVMEVADAFRDAETNFIVPGHPEVLFADTCLDISHESLIRQWDRLQEWARTEADSAKIYLRLASTAELWRQGGAAPLCTPELENAQKWQKEQRPNGAWAERYGGDLELTMRFLSISEAEQEKERAEKEAAQREKEESLRRLAEAETQRARDQEAAARKYRHVAVFAGVLFVLATGTSVWGWISAKQAVEAEVKAKAAETKALEGEATALAGEAKWVAVLSEQALEKGDNRAAVRLPLKMFVKNANRLDKLHGIPDLVTSSKLTNALHTSENALLKALYRPFGVVLEHPSRLYAANFSDDGRFVVTAADSGVVRIWDAATGRPAGKPFRSRGQARWASFDPSGNRVIVSYFDPSSPSGSSAKIWDRRKNGFVTKFAGHSAPINVAVFSGDGTKVVTASFDETARLWNAADGKFLQEFKGHTQGLISAEFDPDGSRVVTAGFDRTARVWDTATGEQVGHSLVHTAPVISARFDNDGRYIVTGSMDNKARVWDPGLCKGDAQACRPVQTLEGHRKRVASAMFSRDGSRVLTASSDKTVRIWDWRSGATLVVLQGPSGFFGWINRGVFSPGEDRLLASFGGTSAFIWDLRKHDPIKPIALEGHKGDVQYADFVRDGDLLVTASRDTTARVWNLTTNEQVRALEHDDPVYSAAFDPSGRWIITAAGEAAHIWDRHTGKRVGLLEGHENRLTHARFAPGGDRVVTSSIDGTARLWDSKTRKEIAAVSHGRSAVKHVAFSPDGNHIVTASTDGTARVWDAATGNELLVLGGHSGAVNSAEFDAGGARIVTASEDRKLRVWDAGSGALIGDPFAIEPTSVPASAVFSPDGRYILAAVADGSARIMDAKSGATLATLHRHRKAVNWAGYDPEGLRIVTASADGTARVWKVPTDLQSKIELACGLLSPLSDEEVEHLGTACSDVQVGAR